jgi:hypothetical protein
MHARRSISDSFGLSSKATGTQPGADGATTAGGAFLPARSVTAHTRAPRPIEEKRVSIRVTAALATIVALLLQACATNYTAEYQARLLGSLPDRREVSFSDSRSYPGDVLCGRYTSLTGHGFSLVTRDYVVTPALVLSQPSTLQKQIYCSTQPKEILFETLGIGGDDADWDRLAQICDDFQAIDGAILRYYRLRHLLPAQLDDLLTGPYELMADELRDPWGRVYDYAPDLSGGTTPRFALSTPGADGRSGGRGMDADVAFEHRHLVEHVLRVEGYGR